MVSLNRFEDEVDFAGGQGRLVPGNPSRGRARHLTSTDGTIKKGVKKVKEIS